MIHTITSVHRMDDGLITQIEGKKEDGTSFSFPLNMETLDYAINHTFVVQGHPESQVLIYFGKPQGHHPAGVRIKAYISGQAENYMDVYFPHVPPSQD